MASLCTLYDYVYRSDGQPLSNIYGYLKILELPVYYSGYFSPPDAPGFKSYTNASGYIFWIVPQGAIVQIRIESIGLYKQFTAPSSSSGLIGAL